MNQTQQKVVKFVQELLVDDADRSAITPALISEKIDLVLLLNPKWREDLDRDVVIDELIRRFSFWIGQDTILRNDAGHVAWLNAARKQEWRYWQRYREWLERKLSLRSVEALDRSTDTVLGQLEDPLRSGPWDRRGLVVGHVQSGKTGNYTGLICKAADGGYKIIIVLAGLHNNLRSQTQMRLDEGFLGYETKPNHEDIQIIGVGEIDGDLSIRPNYATNRSEKGDFNTAAARTMGITPEQRPWLFVVKKNATVLKRLHEWIRDHVTTSFDQKRSRRVVGNLPLLVIDDEADNASVDTGEQVFDSDGKPDDEHQPTVINGWIRQILNSFSRSAYVGYTATPFANIFIHERGETLKEGLDLFPSAFIINLASSSNYIGPAKVFGLGSGNQRIKGLPLVRLVADHAEPDGVHGWMPQGHKSWHQPIHQSSEAMPASLVEAIDAFILACVLRNLRGQSRDHSSMLIHVTRFTNVQQAVGNQVAQYLRHTTQRILRQVAHEESLARLERLWRSDFLVTTRAIAQLGEEFATRIDPSWEEVANELPNVLPDIQVKLINGTAKDALDYADSQGIGLKVIAIGGDKLARGLTLEGLCVSYFLRASKMYDTLMQMGRWFGYRPGYVDLCRLYTTAELLEWFQHITEAAEELREEFEMMAASGSTPREYGLKVQSHSVLMVTSRMKMRAARNLMLSFSGQLLETVALYRDAQVLQRNLEVLRNLLSQLDSPELNPVRKRGGTENRWEGYLWENVPSNLVVSFLLSYRTHPDAYRVNSPLIAQFIESMTVERELTLWNIALIGGGQGKDLEILQGVHVAMLKRKAESTDENRYSIGRLLSPRDEGIDLEEPAWIRALNLTREAWKADPARSKAGEPPDSPSGVAIRKIKGFGAPGVPARPQKGLLMLYVLDPLEADPRFDATTPPIVAFGISFPGSNSGVKVEYMVNNVLYEQEYGAAD